MKKKWELGADIDISKLLSGLQKAKTQAEGLDDIMSSIGNYGNLNTLIKQFKEFNDTIEEMQDSVNDIQSKLGKTVKGGFISGLDDIFKRLSNISDISKNVFTGIANLNLNDKDIGTKLSRYAEQLNMLFKNFGISQKIDLDMFDQMSIKKKFDAILGYAGSFSTELKTVLSSIDTGNLGNLVGENITKASGVITAAMQEQIDATQKKIDQYNKMLEGLKSTFKNVKKYNEFDEIDPGLKGVKDQDQYVKQAVDDYKKYRDATKDFRNGSRAPISTSDYELLVKYTDSLLKITSLQDHTEKLKINNNLMMNLNNALDADEGYDEWIAAFEDKFKTSITKALKDGIAAGQTEIEKIKREGAQLDTTAPLTYPEDNVSKKLQQYKDLLAVLQEYAQAFNKIGDAEDASLIAIQDRLENMLSSMSFTGSKKEVKDIIGTIKDLTGDIEYGEITEDALPFRLAEILGIEVPQAANKASPAIEKIGQYAVDATGYINNMTTALRNLFDAASKNSEVEYKILINGQEIDARAGQAGEIASKTFAEAYLANLDNNTIVDAHSHQGLSANINIPDLKSAIAAQYSGVAKVSAIISNKDILTLDLAKVKAEDAYQALEKVKTIIAGSKLNTVSAQQLNDVFKEINPEYDNIAQRWAPDKFNDLASYFVKIETSATQALSPLERFKNLLMYMTEGKIDLSKYDKLFESFSSNNAINIFNQIMKSENIFENGKLLQASDVQKGSIDNIINDLQKQKDAYVQLRNEADITYSDIQKRVKECVADLQSGGTGMDTYNFFAKFFSKDEMLEVGRVFEQLQDGMIGVNQASNQLAGYFTNLDPSDFLPIATSAEQAAEATKKENEELREKNSLLENELTRRQQMVETAQAAANAAQEELDLERYTSQECSVRAINEEFRADKEKERADLLEQQNTKLKEQLGFEKQIAVQDSTGDDDVEIIQKENGALEDKLEILRDIAEEYGIQVTQKDRTRYDELMLKDAESGLSSREEERLDELGDRIYDVDEALNEFGATYDRIILKLANGKKVEILPDDDGLRKLNRIANEYYDGEYAGSEIENIQFERVKQQLGVEIPQAAEVAKEAIKEVGQAVEQTQKNGITTETSNLYEAASGQMSLLPIIEQEVAAKDELTDKNREVTETQKEINQLQGQISFDDIVKEETVAKQKLVEENKKVAETQKEINNENQKAQKGTKQQAQKTTKKTDAEKTIENEKISMSRRMRTADKRYDIITNNTGTSQMVGSARQAYNDYLAIYKEFKNLYNQINRGAISITPDVTKQFNILEASTKEALQNLDKIEKASKKLRENVGKANVQDLKPTDINNLDTLRQKMEDFARLTQGGTVTNLQFNEATKTLTYGLNNGRGTIEKMTISVDEYSNSLVRAKVKTGDVTTAFGKFSKIINEGWTNVFRYVSSFVGFYEVINQIRTGVTYVKEIDTALTELKKVTDETDATYDKFLKRMSKTAGVVGSTVSNLTTMASEWARLGYSLQEAGDLAESTAILLNVSEFNDATEASEALISTIQAFGYAANESMSVVDVLNEIGKYIACR